MVSSSGASSGSTEDAEREEKKDSLERDRRGAVVVLRYGEAGLSGGEAGLCGVETGAGALPDAAPSL